MGTIGGTSGSDRHRRWCAAVVASIVALAVGVTGFEAAPAPAAVTAPVPPKAAQPAAKVSQRPDEVSAQVTAIAQGSRVEALNKRTADSQTFANPDGTWTTQMFDGPVFVRQGDGWVDADQTLVVEGDVVVPKASPVEVEVSAGEQVPSGGDAATLASLAAPDSGGGQARMELGWEGDLPKPSLDGDTATFADAVGADGEPASTPAPDTATPSTSTAPHDTDPVGEVAVTASGEGFTHSVILDAEPAGAGDVSWRYPLGLSEGLSVRVDRPSGAILVQDSSGERVFGAPAPLMWDARLEAKAGPDTPAVVKPVKTEIITEPSGPVLVLTADGDFLHDPATRYPVTVDPSWYSASPTDTWIQYPNYLSGQGSSPELKAGTFDGGATKARSFLRYNVQALAGKQVTNATLTMQNYYSGSCTGGNVLVQRITSGWDPFTITWSNQPSATIDGQVVSAVAKGYNSSCAGGKVTWGNLASVVQQWTNGVQNHGLRVIGQNETSNFTWRRYRSNDYSDAAQRPRLDITYNSYPNTPWAANTNEGGYKYWTDPNTGIRHVYVPTTKPKLSALVSDPDGGQVKAMFTLWNNGTMIWNRYSGPFVASGGRSVFTPGSNVAPLIDGNTYTWNALASDGTLVSKNASPTGTFIVDVTPPAKPTITATGYAAGDWLDTAPSANTFTYSSTSADTDTFQTSQDGGAWITRPATGTSPRTGTLAWAPQNGAHTLSVRAVDRAGNLSPVQTFTFGAGQATLTSPATGTKSHDAFALEASAPPAGGGNVKASVYWRASGASEPADFDPIRGSTTGWTKQGDDTTAPAGEPIEVAKDFSGADAAQTLGRERIPVLLDIQVCFTYSSTTQTRCTWRADPTTHVSVLRVPHAFGANYPVADAGPGQVGLWTGEFETTSTDVSVPGYSGDLSITRTYSSFDGSIEATESVFGPGWRAGFDGEGAGMASYSIYDSTLADGTFALIDDDGEALVFTQPGTGRIQAKPGIYTPVDHDTASATIRFEVVGTGSNARVVVTEPNGTITTFRPAAFTPGEQTHWVVESEADPADPGQTTYTYDGQGRVTRILSPVPTGVTCGAGTALNPGCRALHITYANATTATESQPGDHAGQVKQISYQAYNPTKTGGPGMDTAIVATYTYNASGHLTAVTDPRNNLTTSYGWGDKLDSGQPALTKIGPPGLAAYYLAYATTSQGADGLISLRRDPASGSGDKVQLARFVYGLDPTQTAPGQPGLKAADVALWGQATPPVWGAAVFSQDHPVASSNPADLAGDDWQYASLQYTDATGNTLNTATYGAGAWQYSALDLDAKGNPIRSWDPGGIDRIRQAANQDGTPAGQTYPTALDQASITRYNPDITTPTAIDVNVTQPDGSTTITAGTVIVPAGTLVTDTWGPITTSATGAQVRPHTHTTYDADAPNHGVKATTGIAYQLPTSITLTEADPVTATTDPAVTLPTGEPVLSQTLSGYDPINALPATDPTSGWMLGAATSTTTVMSSGQANLVALARYDAQGNPVETRKPGSTGADAATTLTTYYTATGSGQCAGKPQWAGMACKTTPGGQPAGEAPFPTATVADYSFYLAPSRVVETAGGVSRTTTTTFLADGAPDTTSLAVTGLPGSTPLPITKNIYDPSTGIQTATATLDSQGAETARVSAALDAWGRQTGYTDTDGAVTSTEYNNAGQVSKVIDPTGTITYTYDGTDAAGKSEHRGLVTKTDISGGGTFTAAYNATGAMVRQDMPGQVRQDNTFDPTTGAQTGQSYTGAGGQWLTWQMAHDARGLQIAQTTPGPGEGTGVAPGGGYDRTYTYDRASRLTTVNDAVAAADDDDTPTCTQRTYTFDTHGNRQTRDTATTPGNCGQDPTGSATWRYDSAGRVQTGANNTGTYVYDALGRQTTIPATDTPHGAGAGNIQAAYYDNDAIKSITQGSTLTDYTLDPTGRRQVATTTSGTSTQTLTRHYVDDSDNPGWATQQKDGQTTTTRYAQSIAGDLGLTISGSNVQLTLADPHGNIVTTIAVPTSGPANGIESWSDTDEYGNPLTALPNTGPVTYGWLGANQRAIETSGLTLMGARLYNPATGLFTSLDPVPGGGATNYAYPTDPINQADLDGKRWHPGKWWHKVENAARRAARAIGHAFHRAASAAEHAAHRAYTAIRHAAHHTARAIARAASRAVHSHSVENWYKKHARSIAHTQFNIGMHLAATAMGTPCSGAMVVCSALWNMSISDLVYSGNMWIDRDFHHKTTPSEKRSYRHDALEFSVKGAYRTVKRWF